MGGSRRNSGDGSPQKPPGGHRGIRRFECAKLGQQALTESPGSWLLVVLRAEKERHPHEDRRESPSFEIAAAELAPIGPDKGPGSALTFP